MLHPYQVARAVYYGQRWRLKRFLRIADPVRGPVVEGDSDLAFARHLRICELLKSTLSRQPFEPGFIGCEIGCGDCLASADLLLGEGAAKVYLVEGSPIYTGDRQFDLLARLAAVPGLPNRAEALLKGNPPVINREKIVVVPEIFENSQLPEAVDLIFSFDVLEHVEDLAGFFAGCARVLKPGGRMIHKFDLSGHEFFEDPLPSLDFQTYPDWLYTLMFPKYRRATRFFLDQHVSAIRAAGFEEPTVEMITTADPDYTERLHPHMRSAAKKRSVGELTPLDVVLQAKAPAAKSRD